MTDLVQFLVCLSAAWSLWTGVSWALSRLADEPEWEAILEPQLRRAPDNDNALAPPDAETLPGATVRARRRA